MMPLPRFALIGTVMLTACPLGGCGRDVPALLRVGLTGIEASPAAIALDRDGSAQLAVTAIFSDGERADVTHGLDGTVYADFDTAVIHVSENGLVRAVGPGNTQIAIAHERFEANVQVTVRSAGDAFKNILIAPALAALEFDQVLPLEVTGLRADGSRANLVREGYPVELRSSDTGIVRVEPTGLATAGRTSGTALITGRLGALQATSEIRVRPPASLLRGIDARPDFITVPQGARAQISVVGLYSDGSTADLTLGATGTSYEASRESGVRIDGDGVIEGLSGGSRGTIRARNSGFEDRVVVEVAAPARALAIQVVPGEIGLRIGEVLQLAVFVFYDNGIQLDVTNGSTGTQYVPPTNGIISTTANGLLQASAGGAGTLLVRNSGLEAAISVKVEDGSPKLFGIQLDAPRTIPAGESRPYAVNGLYTDGSVRDITSDANVSASVDDPFVLGVQVGTLIALHAGTTRLNVVHAAGFTDAVQIQVTDRNPQDPVVALFFQPSQLTIQIGAQATASLLALHQSGTIANVTSDPQVSYLPSGPIMISVPPSSGTVVIQTFGSGPAQIDAVYEGLIAQLPIVIAQDLPLVGIRIFAPTGLTVMETQPYFVFASFANGSLQDITSDPALSVISGAPGIASVGFGAISGISPGTAEINASYLGFTATASVRVTATRSVVQISLQAPPQMDVGSMASYQVSAFYSDGSVVDISSDPTLSVTVADPAILSASLGTLVALSAGQTTIAATYQGLTDSANISVVDGNQVAAIFWQPAQVSLQGGRNARVSLFALTFNGNTRDITADPQTSYTSSGPITIQVTGGTLRVTALQPGGIAQVNASYLGLSAALPVSVGNAPLLVGITVTPATIQIGVGGTASITVTALYSDGSQRIIVGATMGSVDTSIAIVTNGVVTGISGGSTGIIIIFGNFVNFVSVDVQG